MFDFTGKRALVTGAGRGIGRQVAKTLLKCGAKVIALDVMKENLESLKEENNEIEIVCVDLSEWNTTRKCIEKLGDIDLLVNNAAIVELKSFEEITEEHFDRIFAVNAKPIINVSQVIVKNLKEKRKPGSIVNLASITADKYFPSFVAYSMGKAALVRLTKSMAVELGPNQIRVNAVSPAVVKTDMSAKVSTIPKLEEWKKNTPLGRFNETEDVASVILFLLSDEATMITGSNISIDGGFSAN